MDWRCPACGANLAKRKLTQAVVVRMERECSHCKRALRLNIHPVEEIAVLLSFGIVVALAAFAYWFQSQGLVITALGAAMAGALALPLIERVYLRSWPRYVPGDQLPVTGRS